MELNLDNSTVTDAGLARLKGLKNLRPLFLYNTTATGSGLAGMTDSPLEQLTIGPRLTPDGIAAVALFSTLRHLTLQSRDVFAQAAQVLRAMKNLTHLRLATTRLSDNGLAALAGIKGLQLLDLSETLVTGDGLRHLAGMGGLQQLYLNSTPLQDGGLKRLQSACRTCTSSRSKIRA